MIVLKNIDSCVEKEINPTVFPDHTSQVWHLNEFLLGDGHWMVVWHWQNESEIMTICSLAKLLEGKDVILYIPYFPYARQDKAVSNDNTFNLRVFALILNGLNFRKVIAADVHNPELTSELVNNFDNHPIFDRFIKTHSKRWDMICFPDAGALARYRRFLGPNIQFFFFEKKRDQATGKIISHVTYHDLDSIKDKKILIVDDICDRGGTFISIANTLKKYLPYSVDLYVTHGIFSGELDIIFDSGIKEIYTTDSLIENNNRSKRINVMKI